MNLFWLLRLRRWVQHPPSRKTLMVIAIVVIASFALFFYEKTFGWPEWLTVNPRHRP